MSFEEKIIELNGLVRDMGDDFVPRLKAVENEVVKMKAPGADYCSVAPVSLEGKAFSRYLRKGREGLHPDETKSLRVSDAAQAGYLCPPEFANEIIKSVSEYSPIRTVAKIRTTNRESFEMPKRVGTGTATWVSETGTRSEVTGLSYGKEIITPHEMTYLAKASLAMIEDSAFNLEQELVEEFGRSFAVLEGTAFINGDSIGKPEGIMTNASISHIATGSASALTADSIIAVPYQIKAGYRANAVWIMTRATQALIRALKDAVSGNYLWQPGLMNGQPDRLCGYPVVECPDMPEVSAGTFPILFGDFSQGYLIVDRIQMQVQRLSEKYAETGEVGFFARKRVSGQVILAEAFCKLEVAAS
ncbi:MAG: phage major capsid protein [Acidobacteriota bacterium]|nr:phage major capsid protein [Acidobacteriota bacterium]